MNDNNDAFPKQQKGSYVTVLISALGALLVIFAGLSAFHLIAPVQSSAGGDDSLGRETPKTNSVTLALSSSNWKPTNNQNVSTNNTELNFKDNSSFTTSKAEHFLSEYPNGSINVCIVTKGTNATSIEISGESIKPLTYQIDSSNYKRYCKKSTISANVATPQSPDKWNELQIASDDKNTQVRTVLLAPIIN